MLQKSLTSRRVKRELTCKNERIWYMLRMCLFMLCWLTPTGIGTNLLVTLYLNLFYFYFIFLSIVDVPIMGQSRV